MMAQRKYALPAMVTGPADVARLLLEMEALEEYLATATLRHKTESSVEVKLPKMSRTLEALADINDVDLLQNDDRQHLAALLESVQQHAPVVHISFAAEPSAAFTAKIVAWFRGNISQYTLLQVGLQPTIAAGCVVRTTNKMFDFSLRRSLRDKRQLLVDSMHSLAPAAAVGAPAAASATVSQTAAAEKGGAA